MANDENSQKNGEAMKRYLAYYNAYYGTNCKLEALTAYNDNLNDRLARKKKRYKDRKEQIDLVIVVDRLLTGFDAPCLSTLFIDRPPMNPQGLIQAFSRTNRLFDGHKEYGQIVTFRNPKEYKEKINDYLVPQEVYTNPNWGQQTAVNLDNYMQNYNSYPGITHTGIVAPFKDMWRNYKTMTDDQKWVGGDNFFHCKANYEAAKRGPWGEIVGKTISGGRELYGLVKGEPLSDIRKDWHANRIGWSGAKNGLSLNEACPTNPKAYVNPDDYDDIF